MSVCAIINTFLYWHNHVLEINEALARVARYKTGVTEASVYFILQLPNGLSDFNLVHNVLKVNNVRVFLLMVTSAFSKDISK